MTLQTTSRVEVYRGNDAATSFDFNFIIPEASNLTVSLQDYETGDITQVLAPGAYTVIGLGDPAGGSVEYNPGVPLSPDFNIVILRTMPYTQDMDIVNQGGFFPEVVEQQLDDIVMQIQQIAEVQSRSLFVNPGQTPPDGQTLVNAGIYAEQALAAQAAAEAAAASVNIKTVASKALMQDLDPVLTTLVSVNEAGFEGIFNWKVGNYSTQVTADTEGGIYVESDHVASTSGAWVRQFDGEIMSTWFGAIGSGNKQTELQAALRAAEATQELIVNESVELSGDVILPGNSRIKFAPDATLNFSGYSSTGSLVKTVDPTISAVASIKTNITVENFRGDGTNYPDELIFSLVSGTTTEVVLPVGASAVDDFYNGLFIQFMDGVNAADTRTITDYVGSTRTATLSAVITAPTVGDDVQIGWNDNLFGGVGGLTNIHFLGGTFANLEQTKMVPSAGGGKGLNYESAVTNGSLGGATFENLNQAVFIQGLDGTNPAPNSTEKRAVGIRVSDYYVKNCGSALTIAGLNSAAAPDGDSNDSMVIAGNIVYEDVGHAPNRLVGSDQQKSGVINLMEAQNVSIYNVRGRNNTTYPDTSPGYPTDYAARVGFGLSGDIGAMIWGHCRHLRVNGFVHHGNVDAMIRVQRVRALGDDAAGQTGQPRNCYGWFIEGMECHGTAGYVIAIDPTLARRVPDGELTGRVQAVVGAATLICDANMATFEKIIIDVTERGTGKRVVGTPKQIIAGGNTFASFKEQTTVFRQPYTITLADDAVEYIVPPKNSGFLRFCTAAGTSGASANAGQITYAISGAAVAELNYGTSITVGTAVLVAGAAGGIDGDWNIGVVVGDGIYMKNRRGGPRSIDIFFD